MYLINSTLNKLERERNRALGFFSYSSRTARIKKNRALGFMHMMNSSTIFLFFFFLVSTFFSTITPETIRLNLNWSNKSDWQLQHVGKLKRMRFLSIPGSAPPRCSSKCDRCKPCKPVHVPIPPGTPVTAEYYPETWRCKCGNRFYIP